MQRWTRLCWSLLLACQTQQAPNTVQTQVPVAPATAEPDKHDSGCDAKPLLFTDKPTSVRVLPGDRVAEVGPDRPLELDPGVVHLRFGESDWPKELMTAVLPGVHLVELEGAHKAKSTCGRSSLPRGEWGPALETGWVSADGQQVATTNYQWSPLNGIEDISVVVETLPAGERVKRWEPGIETESGPPELRAEQLVEAGNWLSEGGYQREGVALPKEAVRRDGDHLHVSWKGLSGSAGVPSKTDVEMTCCTDDFHIERTVGIERARAVIIEGRRACSYDGREECMDYHPENPSKPARLFVSVGGR